MDGKHEGLSDEALGREIEAALGVDPSPEFLPRVRARVAGERIQDGWLAPRSWQWASVVAAVTAVVIVGSWIVRDATPTREVVRSAPLSVVEPSASAPEVIAAAPETASSGVTPVVSHERSPQRRATPSQEVVISPYEAAALRQLVVAIAARQVEGKDIPELGVESAPLPPLEEIVLEPIKLSPLAGLEGE